MRQYRVFTFFVLFALIVIRQPEMVGPDYRTGIVAYHHGCRAIYKVDGIYANILNLDTKLLFEVFFLAKADFPLLSNPDCRT
jgi:hypothetical protein